MTASTIKESQTSRHTGPVIPLRTDHMLSLPNRAFQKATSKQPIQFAGEHFSIFQDLQDIHRRIDKGEIQIDDLAIRKPESALGNKDLKSQSRLELDYED